MDSWIDFARGPLFRISLAIFVLGATYRVAVMVTQAVRAWRRAGDHRVPIRAIVAATVRWLVPLESLRIRPEVGLPSLLLHLGLVVAPIFLAGHAVLALGPGARWPTLPQVAADMMTLAGIVGAVALMIVRLGSRIGRALTRSGHVATLGLIAVTLAAGFLAAHPELSPLSGRGVVLIHILAGDLILIMIPTSRIAHCVLAPFTHLVFQLSWHFPAATGRHVAQALAKEDQPI